MNRQRNWKADCRDMSYKGGEWPRDEFLQWEVEGIDEPRGRGNYYQDDAYLIAAAPAMLAALEGIASLENTEENEWDGVERLIPQMCSIAREAIKKATGAA